MSVHPILLVANSRRALAVRHSLLLHARRSFNRLDPLLSVFFYLAQSLEYSTGIQEYSTEMWKKIFGYIPSAFLYRSFTAENEPNWF